MKFCVSRLKALVGLSLLFVVFGLKAPSSPTVEDQLMSLFPPETISLCKDLSDNFAARASIDSERAKDFFEPCTRLFVVLRLLCLDAEVLFKALSMCSVSEDLQRESLLTKLFYKKVVEINVCLLQIAYELGFCAQWSGIISAVMDFVETTPDQYKIDASELRFPTYCASGDSKKPVLVGFNDRLILEMQEAIPELRKKLVFPEACFCLPS